MKASDHIINSKFLRGYGTGVGSGGFNISKNPSTFFHKLCREDRRSMIDLQDTTIS